MLPLILLQSAFAQDYSFATSSDDYSTFYPTAYRDAGGQDWNCGNTYYSGHTGQDFGFGSFAGMDAGRDIVAAADGVVTYVHDGEYDRCTTGACGTANWVKILHADGKETWYVHLKQWSILVQVGDVVFCGQKLGDGGSSGNSTGPHLHFTVYSGGTRDAFDGPCTTSPGYWVDQNAYLSIPGRTCDIEDNPDLMSVGGLAQSVDVNGDDVPDACGRAAGGVLCSLGGPTGWAGSITSTVMSDASGWDQPEHYLTMRMGDVNGDGLTDLCARGGASIYCWHSTGTGFGSSYAGPTWSDAAGFTAAKYYATFRLLDVDGDGDQDACIRSSTGMLCAPSLGGSFGPAFAGPAWTDASGYNQPDNYLTIRAGDFTGDGLDDLCIRANGGMRCFASSGTGFGPSISGPTWDDASGFAGADQYSTIRMADVNGDGLADLCARTSAGFRCHLSDGAGFGPEHTGPNWADASGWSDADNYGTIQLGDLDGDGDLDVCARANANVVCSLWDGDGHDVPVTGPDWSDARGFAYPDHWRTMRLSDVTGDGRDDLCIRAGAGYFCAPSLGTSFGPTMAYNSWSDANGWFQPEQHTAIVTGSSSCPDHDRDGTTDCQDACDDDPAKVTAGVCGCGVPDDDRDGDGWLDCEELCPDDPLRQDPGVCGCGASDGDADGDGWADCTETCDDDPAKQEPGACGCGVSDGDRDGDGWLDCEELCDDDGAKLDPGQCGCGLSDVDADADLWADCVDACPLDAAKQDPGACGCGASDADSNGNGAPDCLDCGDGVLEVPETCDDGGRVSGDGCDDVCQLEDLTVGAWVPGRAGVVNTITVRGASPGAQIVLLAGITLGSTPVPGCPGVTIPLRGPRVLSASNADIAGTTTTSLNTPANLAGATAVYVAVERATCRVSAMGSQGL